MALTESNMLDLGTKAPDFDLLDTVSGKNVALKDFQDNAALVVMFICNHCPFVIHVNEALVKLAKDYESKNVGFVAISSNDVENYPQDGPELMTAHAKENAYPFPYLYDETQEVAKAYAAACTPDFYVFDGDMNLFYRGRMDASRPGNDQPNDGSDIRNAIDLALNNGQSPASQYPSAGCNIKWK